VFECRWHETFLLHRSSSGQERMNFLCIPLEYLLLPPRSAAKTVPPRVTPSFRVVSSFSGVHGFTTVFTPSYSLGLSCVQEREKERPEREPQPPFCDFTPEPSLTLHSLPQRSSISGVFERHPFSGPIHSAGKLLHTSWRVPTSVATVLLSLWINTL